jgi:hypothetical protein
MDWVAGLGSGDGVRRSVAAGASRGRHGPGNVVPAGAGHRDGHDGRDVGAGRARGGALATVAAVGELVVVETASQLGLLEVSSNVLVRHLLHASLEQVHFLKMMLVRCIETRG